MKYMIANALLAILPPTRWFGLKRLLLGLLGIKTGEGTRICGGVRFFGAGRVEIGRDCWVGLDCAFYTAPGITIAVEDRCDIAPQTVFMAGSHAMGGAERRAGDGWGADIVVGAGSWIGVRSTLLANCRVGPGSMVGAGSLLLHQTYPANTLIAGSPAKVVRLLD